MALTDNLIACYQFENNGNDATPNALTLTNNNSATFATGKVGQATSLALASLQYWSRASEAAYQVSGSFSLAACINFTTVLTTQAIVGKWDGTDGVREYALTYQAGYSFSFAVRNSADTTNHVAQSSFGVASTATWYYVVGVYNSVGPTVNISVNGGAFTSAAGPATPRSGNIAFQVGAYVFPDTFVNGLVDQVLFYKRALTVAGDIATLYNSGNGLSYAQMVALSGGGVSANKLSLLGVGS
jgi:hypothetical protein